jgi:hydroxymethylbilane synthase
LSLRAVVVSEDGADSVRLSATGPADDAVGVGRRLAAELLDEGAGDLMGARIR